MQTFCTSKQIQGDATQWSKRKQKSEHICQIKYIKINTIIKSNGMLIIWNTLKHPNSLRNPYINPQILHSEIVADIKRYYKNKTNIAHIKRVLLISKEETSTAQGDFVSNTQLLVP